MRWAYWLSPSRVGKSSGNLRAKREEERGGPAQSNRARARRTGGLSQLGQSGKRIAAGLHRGPVRGSASATPSLFAAAPHAPYTLLPDPAPAVCSAPAARAAARPLLLVLPLLTIVLGDQPGGGAGLEHAEEELKQRLKSLRLVPPPRLSAGAGLQAAVGGCGCAGSDRMGRKRVG